MAIRENVDYVFAPEVSIGIDDDACFVGTKTHLYVVPDAVCIEARGIREALVAAVSDTYTVENCPLKGTSPSAFIAELLQDPQTTLESLQAFLARLKEGWAEMKAVEIAAVKKLKVKTGVLGATVSVKYPGKLFHSTLVTRFKSGDKQKIKEFFDDVIRNKELFG